MNHGKETGVESDLPRPTSPPQGKESIERTLETKAARRDWVDNTVSAYSVEVDLCHVGELGSVASTMNVERSAMVVVHVDLVNMSERPCLCLFGAKRSGQHGWTAQLGCRGRSERCGSLRECF